ncbi:MAG: hypothetical protein CMK64_05010 [Pseudoalteromonas sp.]|nr:hypothetical protein [Pseudoalteromonas sp.]|tara:strand:- start:12692 stop:13267 length:576 start_codon:yes stop_codon:yes gene_type:complete
MKTFTAFIPCFFNQNKTWVVTRTKQGKYYLNQMIDFKLVYPRSTPIRLYGVSEATCKTVDELKSLFSDDIEIEQGFEDLFSEEPWFDFEIDGTRAYLHKFYVPIHLRRQGFGTAMLKRFLSQLPDYVEVVRLQSIIVNEVDSMPFYLSNGFKQAYETRCEETRRILHIGVNGNKTPLTINHEGKELHYVFD